MRCLENNEMAAFLDGLIDSRELARAQAHFGRCAACREARDELAAMLRMPPLEAGREAVEAGRSLVAADGARTKPWRAARIRPRWAQ